MILSESLYIIESFIKVVRYLPCSILLKTTYMVITKFIYATSENTKLLFCINFNTSLEIRLNFSENIFL